MSSWESPSERIWLRTNRALQNAEYRAAAATFVALFFVGLSIMLFVWWRDAEDRAHDRCACEAPP